MSLQNFGIADPEHFNLTTAVSSVPGYADVLHHVTCYTLQSGNDAGSKIGLRVSALFVIMIVSSAVTFFPVAAARVPRLKINVYVYLFARYFGAGVIVATAFIQYVLLRVG